MTANNTPSQDDLAAPERCVSIWTVSAWPIPTRSQLNQIVSDRYEEPATRPKPLAELQLMISARQSIALDQGRS